MGGAQSDARSAGRAALSPLRLGGVLSLRPLLHCSPYAGRLYGILSNTHTRVTILGGRETMRLFKPDPGEPPPGSPPFCKCLYLQGRKRPYVPSFHNEIQDTDCAAWHRLEEVIEKAIRTDVTILAPLDGFSGEERARIFTLPKTIGKLVAVEQLELYGSHITRLPPEIGGMRALKYLDVYRSVCLHYMPYELTKCSELRDSRVSTRMVYGNYKYRAPFPFLGRDSGDHIPNDSRPAVCSVCSQPFGDKGPRRRWLTLAVGSDWMPLLVHACSEACIDRLPPAAKGYVPKPHKGGRNLQQPAPRL